jgi:pimeloyl-ACP methyl ester carboxylesterase
MKTRAYSVLLVAGALLAGLTACGGAAAFSSGKLSWHPCDGGFRCATLSVPVSYSDPHGLQVPISVVELPALGGHPMGDLVLNPGGPGASGVEFLERGWQIFPGTLRRKFNLVSFDPRGIRSSEPLRCLTRAGIIKWIGVNPVPTTPEQIRHVVLASKAFVRGCQANAPTTFLANMSTANTARDLDRLRAALGQSKLTYAGFSYGTYLGTVYAELFPKHVRAMVLDGAVDPSVDTPTADGQQAAGFETDLRDFFGWCSKDAGCRGGFSTSPAMSYGALMSRFKHGLVIPSSLPPSLGGREPVGYGIALLGVATTLYSTATWPFLSKALAKAETGDGTLLAAAANSYAGQNSDGSFTNILSANLATVCLDRPAPQTIAAYKALAARLARSAPNFGASEAWSTLVCAYWPSRATVPHGPAHAPGAPPLLVIGSTHDPATPYRWAQALAKQLPHATLLTRAGAGHTAYRFSSCIRMWADRYLETLRMPPAGTVCHSD